MVARGLTSVEAQARLAEVGPNEIREAKEHPVRRFLRRLWSPIAWMLEVSIVLELALHRDTQAGIIGGLLLVNAVIGYLEERNARQAVDALRKRLAVRVRALRDGEWRGLSARELVPGDVIRLRVGDVTPADCQVLEGSLLEDRAVVTGESVPVELSAGGRALSGTTVKRGEATARVSRTGASTVFGKTAELVRTSAPAPHLEKVVMRVVRVLVALDGLVVAAVLAKAAADGLAVADILPFVLLLMVASVPVALPATFTLASAVGSQKLGEQGVLVADLSAIEEAASMDVLCCDKTGTVTENRLSVAAQTSYPPGRGDLIELSAQACDAATQDPLDLAILAAAGKSAKLGALRRTRFVPFDPSTKRSEAFVQSAEGELHVIKGAPQVVAALATAPPTLAADVSTIAAGGNRVLAVAVGPVGKLSVIGLIGLADPPRADSREVIERLAALGVRTVLVTGDHLETAKAVAGRVSIRGPALSATQLRSQEYELGPAQVIAEVFPEDKSQVVRALQRAGHVVGMTGDGVNDAPALRQAEVGVAVSRSTDVARAAAGVVLVREGLSGVVDTVETGRRIYQRMLTYTWNKIVKTFQAIMFLGVGYLVAGVMVATPRQLVLLLFLNDFVTMSLATDRICFLSAKPERWNVRAMSLSALLLAGAWVVFTALVFLVGQRVLGLALPALQTLAFVTLVFSGQANIYLVRERRHLWQCAPSAPLAASSVFAVVATCLLATQGWLMAPLAPAVVGGVALAVVAQLLVLDAIKVGLLPRLRTHPVRS